MEDIRSAGATTDHAVWASSMLMQGQNLFGFSWESRERDLEAWVAILHRRDRGEPVPEDFLPEVMWADDAEDDEVQRLPHVFQARNLLVVSEALADILWPFDLGASRLAPVTLLHGDRSRPYAGTHLILDLRERKAAFEPEHSKTFSRPMFPGHTHLGAVVGRPEDGDISVNASALTGADIWSDPRLLKSLFFSDRLMTAMRRAKVLGGVRTFRCPVVPVHRDGERSGMSDAMFWSFDDHGILPRSIRRAARALRD